MGGELKIAVVFPNGVVRFPSFKTQKNRRTEEQKNRRTEEQKNRRTEEQKNRRTEEQKNS